MKIMLFGKQRSGKDTVADYLCKVYGFVKIPLATKVYDIAKDVFGMQEKDRSLLIAIGESLRTIDPAVFAKWVLRQSTQHENIVVPDVRLPIEYMTLLHAGFIPIKVSASQRVRSHRPGFTHEHEKHYTENYFNLFMPFYEIINEGTFEDLYKEIDKMMQFLEDVRT